MKAGLGNIMKQAQAMQEKMQSAQEELAKTEVEGSSGGGLVTITMTCRHDVRKVNIDDDLLGEDKAVVEDLVAAAVNAVLLLLWGQLLLCNLLGLSCLWLAL